MIITTHCMTCGRPLSHLWEGYVKMTRNLMKEYKQDPTEFSKKYKKHPRGIAMDRLNIKKECCRVNMMSTTELTHKIRNRYQD